MTSSWHDASIGLQKTHCVIPLSFHSLSNTDLLHRRGLLSHVFCSSVCVVLATLVQQQWSAHIFGCGYCKYRMNCSATLDCGELDCFLFVLCHSQDDPLALLCQEMAKGISDCSTLTKLSLHHLPPQCSSASVRAAMALQSSLTEVEWSYCDLRGKSDIGVTIRLCVVCGVCMYVWLQRLQEGRERDCVCIFSCICLGVHGCMFVCMCYNVFALCAHHL